MTALATLLRTTTLFALAVPGLAGAQGLPIPFVPHVYAGVEAGRGMRGTTDYAGSGRLGDDEKSLDYGAFAGVELPSLPFGYLAVEGNVGKSDAKTRATSGTGAAAILTQGDADTNWSATARAGINAIPGLAAYGIAGYGAEKVDITTTTIATGLVTGDDRRSLDGLIYGLGARYTFGRFLGARVEYRRMATEGRYDLERVMAGLYFRL
ncbi:outer membrane protein [Sphingomonas prati]|uniref:Opacity protein-like surface antigen n=1 Tax=Sphingomonas prati TaxID=1843237 RepID=A0A7W9F1Y6_9SPHN|nr:outer membrane beta-barrel protein [Sphingomonas prati]MBB5729751.1 opacity protein-like surface antigen [Sphingomonas prati]GGE89789.1 hypothetical protein GCM10011404_23330 [Sphingomonas prati]